MTAALEDSESKIVYWHRELPPLEAALVAEHTVEANSNRVPGTIARRDELHQAAFSVGHQLPVALVPGQRLRHGP